MSESLEPRDRCLEQLRARCAGDMHLLAYALLGACERLDLGQLNDLVRDVATYDDESWHEATKLLQHLLAERFGLN
jgi:hypothetical protein